MNFSTQFIEHMGVGRRPKLTPEIAELFLDTYRSTGNVRASAHRAGLHPATVFAYLAKGRQQHSGPLREFLDAVTRAHGDYIGALASTHHRMAVGGVRRKPRCKVITLEDGRQVETTEIERNAKDEIVWIEHWQEPDPRAMEWEMRFLDRETYGDDGGSASELGGAAGEGLRQASQVVGVFAAALELMSKYRVTPALAGPAIETTAKLIEGSDER